MNKRLNFKKLAALLILFLASSFAGNAQRTGNIVEIFGKEKVETIQEGNILHTFTSGLALRDAIKPGMLSGSQDILFWQMAVNQFEIPFQGMQLKDNYDADSISKPLIWEEIKADETNVFKGNLNRAYLYTEYHSDEEKIVLLNATGHTKAIINGLPREGDHYDYAYTLIPFKLKKGTNQFVYTYGRFARVSSRLVEPRQPIMISNRDFTLPSIIRGEKSYKWGAARVINASEDHLNAYILECVLETGETEKTTLGGIMPLTTRKLGFKIPAPAGKVKKSFVTASLILRDSKGQEIDRSSILIKVHNANEHHERTFISKIDGSVQYYSVAPSSSKAVNQAFVLSVHGASVEATNQARAYKQKDWAHIVAPTNRRPFGFNWEEWGRLDALEVLADAKKIFPTHPQKTYLTGHSMGGHGSWFLGATYPDKWAAIAPAAGYPDIIRYRRTGTDSLMRSKPHFEMIERGALAGRVVQLAHNYLQSGVYVLHGDADGVVSVEQARTMRGVLGSFHNNFAYYEYPGGSHWYGDHSMDWPPLFDFLKQNTIPETHTVDSFAFITASPAVSASNYWISINQQIKPYTHASVKAWKNLDTIRLNTDNVENISVLFSSLRFKSNPTLIIDNQSFKPSHQNDLYLKLSEGKWQMLSALNPSQKSPERSGPFKLAFTNNMLFVYATNGSAEENQWYQNKARFDAESFLYLGNGSIDIIPDTDFSPEKYKDRNILLYGNAHNNLAWNKLLSECPVQVNNNSIHFGNKTFQGDDLGTFFVYPRNDSKIASIGVVAATGQKGMKALYPNDYFSGITGFPDLLIFNTDWLKEGMDKIIVSGFFGNDWSIEKGDFKQ